jgi:AraC family transcriptional regulator
MTLRIHVYQNLALAFAREHHSSLHAHQALQMTIALDGDFGLEIQDAHGTTQGMQASFVCVAPQQTHRIVSHDNVLSYLYVDTNPVAYATWRNNGGTPIPPDDALLQALRDLLHRPQTDRETIRRLAYRWYEHTLPGLLDIAPTDARIGEAMRIIDKDPLNTLNYSALARMVHLSPSRFASVFREQTGLPVRNYVLWRRLVYVFDRLEHGDSITEAAHNAGFSDCAHLSRSFHRICGTMPSNIQML